MADKKPVKRAASKSAKTSKGFTDDEKAAMRERAKEAKAAARGASKDDDERSVLDKIAAMEGSDRTMGERIHAIVKAAAPDLSPRLWYGMPAYANDAGVVCFFQDAKKFKSRYATLGFSDKANLDEGEMWPISYALRNLTASDEARIRDLIKRAVR